jgi:tetratricopeptide (TPR) repeat protein
MSQSKRLEPHAQPRPFKWNWQATVVCAALVALVWIAFGQTAGDGFVNFDDEDYVYRNPAISQGLGPWSVEWAFTHLVSANWHPLTMLAHMVDCRLYGLWPGGHHLTNVLLHSICAVLVFVALVEMTGARWRSGFVAAIFAIHPLRAESVAWVSELKDVLSGVFFMLTLWAYARYVRQRSAGRYAAVMLWYVMALLSKPMVVTLPFVLLLLDWWPLKRVKAIGELAALAVEKWPLFLLSALSCAATVLAQRQAIQPVARYPLWLRLEDAAVGYAAYVEKLVWPSGLAALYPMRPGGWPWWELIGSVLILGGLSAGAWAVRRSQPWVLVGWLWYLGMLVPVIGLVQVGEQAYADRYTYLPEIGLCMGGVWAAAEWAGAVQGGRVALGAAGAGILAALLVAAYYQAGYWRNSETLWTHTLECTRDNYVAHQNLGNALLKQGRIDEAIPQFREALRINPEYTLARDNLGAALSRQGRAQEAVAQYRESLETDPNDSEAWNNIGMVLLQQGRIDEAAARFREAVRINPEYGDAHYNLAVALEQKGEGAEAIEQYQRALEANPSFPEAYNNLGGLLEGSGHPDEAIGCYQKALEVDGRDAEAWNNLGGALVSKGDLDKGMADLQKALEIKPAYAEAHYNLGVAYRQKGEPGEAIAEYEKALEDKADFAGAQGELAYLLAVCRDGRLRDGVKAEQLAKRADQLAGGANPVVLGTLAAAYAEEGRFEEAKQTVQRAIEVAQAQGNAGLGNALQGHLKLYQAGQPLRDY